jgi:hypothetical protein
MRKAIILLLAGFLITTGISAQTVEQGKAFDKAYRFEDAIKTYDAFITKQKKRRRPTAEAEQLLEKSKERLRMLKGVEQVCIIDSVVVDKAKLLDAYKISPESGMLFAYNEYFQNKAPQEATVYETEMGDKLYYGELDADGRYSIVTRNKLQGEWGRARLLPETINDSINANYPYVLTDGITIYYAGDAKSGLGGYDIYVTRYNTGNDTYLNPEGVGMPFNSPSNDYLYVIDEFSDLGWFASDRRQPAGKVCVYIFVPNESKKVYNYESIDKEKLGRLAQISSIKETWTDMEVVKAAQARLQAIRNAKPQTKKVYDFAPFVINDSYTYDQWSDFRSQVAKELFRSYLQKVKAQEEQQARLQQLRDQYAAGNAAEKQKLTATILAIEKQQDEQAEALLKAAVEVRNTEIKTLK